MISLRQLRYLDAIATHLHFRKAAEAVAVSQPALSMQLKELEDNLGLKLIERQPSAIRLTREGEEVVIRARKILADVQDLVDTAKHLSEPLTGSLRLGIIPSIAPYLLPRLLPALEAAHPDLKPVVRETLTEQLVEELLAGRLDAVIIALPYAQPSLREEPLFIDRFLLAQQSGSASGSARQALSDALDGDQLLLLEEGHCLRDQALNYCQNLPAKAASALGATSLSTVMQMVAAGYGVTLLPELCADVEVRDDRVTLLRFEEPQPSRTVGLAWRKSSPRLSDFQALAKTLRTTFAGEGLTLP